MSDDETVIGEPPESHPDAAEKVEGHVSRAKELAEGHVDVPWPHTSKGIYSAATVLIATGFGLILWAFFTVGDSADVGYLGASFACFAGAAALYNWGRFVHRHFENGPQPRHVEEDR